MKITSSWWAELWYALRTLPRNPYVRHRLDRMWKWQIFVPLILGYLVLTIAQAAINWAILSSPLDLKTSLLLDLSLQMTYLQQQSGLFIGVGILLPLITVITIIREKRQNRLSFVQLTPLTQHQIMIGMISREFMVIIPGILLHIPITLVSLLMNNVEYLYVVVTTFSLLLTALFFLMLAFLVGLFCGKNLNVGITVILILCIGNFYWYELLASHLGERTIQRCIDAMPFGLMSTQGIQLAPIRVQIPHIVSNLFFYCLNASVDKSPIRYRWSSYWDWTYQRQLQLQIPSIELRRWQIQEGKGEIKICDTVFEQILKSLISSLFTKTNDPDIPPYPSEELSGNTNFIVTYKSSYSKLYLSNLFLNKLVLKERDLYPELKYSLEDLAQSIIKLEKLLEEIRLSLWSKRLIFLFENWIRYAKMYSSFKSQTEPIKIIPIARIPPWVPSSDPIEGMFIAIKDIKQNRNRFLPNHSSLVVNFPYLYQNKALPFFLQYIKETVKWYKLNPSKIENQVNFIEERFKHFMAQVVEVKLPISLSNTNLIGFRLEDQNLWGPFFYNILVKIILISGGYLFIYRYLFFHSSLFILNSLTLGLIFVLLSIFALSTSDESAFYNLLYTPLFILLLLYNTIPLAKIKPLRLWEKLIAIFNPFVYLSMTFALSWYFIWKWYEVYEYYDVRAATWIFLYIIFSYEYARQWLSFKLSKTKAGIAAFGVMTIFLVLSGFTEQFARFEIITYLAIIHGMLVLIYLLSLRYQSKTKKTV